MTQREAIKSFNERIIRSGGKSDDYPKSDREILRRINSLLIVFKQRAILDKNNISINEFDRVALKIKLQKVDMIDFISGIYSNQYWYKSVLNIPRPLKIFSVTDVLGQENIDYIEWASLKRRQSIRLDYLKDKKTYSLKSENDSINLYLKLPINANWDCCQMEIIPENYYEAITYSICGQKNKELLCNPLDTKMGASDGLIIQAIDMLVQREQPIIDIKDNDNPIQ